MSAIRVPTPSMSPVTAVMSPVLGGFDRFFEPLLSTARRGGMVAAVVTASTLGLLGGRGEVVYPRAASRLDPDLAGAAHPPLRR